MEIMENNINADGNLQELIQILASNPRGKSFPNIDKLSANRNKGLIQALGNWEHVITRFHIAQGTLHIYLEAFSGVDGETLIAIEKVLEKYLGIAEAKLYIIFSDTVINSPNYLCKLLPWAAENMISHNFGIFSALLDNFKAKSNGRYLEITVPSEHRKIFSSENRALLEDFFSERLNIECNANIKSDDDESNIVLDFANIREESFEEYARELSSKAYEESLIQAEEETVRRLNSQGEPVTETLNGQSNNNSAQRQAKNNKSEKKKYSYSKSPNHVYGRLDNRLELTKINELDSESGRVSVYGKIAFYESRLVSNNTRVLIKFSIHGIKGAISCLLFMNEIETEEDFHSKVKDGVYVRADLDVSYDGQFSKDLQGFVRGIELAEAPEQRQDNAPVKRVELHAHTNMSERDGISRPKELVQLANRFGMPAVSVTDHGIAQAYPEAAGELKKLRAAGSDMKLIYGCEIYLTDDGNAIAYGLNDLHIGDRYVSISIKTTGSDTRYDRLLYFEAIEFVRSENQEDYTAKRNFKTYLNPEIEISNETMEEREITPESIANAPKSLVAIQAIYDFIAKDPVVSVQGLDVLGFLRYEAYRTPNYDDAHLKFNPVFIDMNALVQFELNEDFDSEMLCDKYEYELDLTLDFGQTKLQGLVFNTIWSKHDYMPLRELNELAGQDSFETVTAHKNKPYHGIILVKDLLGLYHLYRLISESHIRYFKSRPRMPKSLIKYFRQGMMIGTSCEAGQALRRIREIYIDVEGDFDAAKAVLDNDFDIQEKMKLYDYLEIQPLGNNLFMLDKEDNYIHSIDDLINLNKLVIHLAELVDRPVVATSDSHFLEEDDMIYRQILQAGSGFDPNENPTALYIRTTKEMLDEFYYLPESQAYEIVVTNTNNIANEVEPDLYPYPGGTYPPEIESAPDEVRELTWNTCNDLYGHKGELPKIITDRVERELNSIIDNGFSVMYYISYKLVKHTNDDGYIVGSRGSVGSSVVAYLCGISEVNPLEPHYVCDSCQYTEFVDTQKYGSGFDLPIKSCPSCDSELRGDGQNIPFETFLGFNGDKEPDIDLNFSGEYQAEAHQYIIEMFGEDYTYRAGTITSYAEKNAMGLVLNYAEVKDIFITRAETERLAAGLNGIKRSTGQHPGGVVVIPKDREIYDFTPIQFPANKSDAVMTTTHFDFHSLDETILKLDILGHDDPTMLKVMSDITGVDVMKIPVNDEKVMQIFQGSKILGIADGATPDSSGTLGIPEFGTLMARDMIKETKPTKFNDLLQLMGLSHGTDVWANNAQDLIRSGTATLNEVIGCRDDIMTSLIAWGLEPLQSFQIMEKVRKGRGLSPDEEAAMRTNDVPEWYIESCKKIKYMFPRAHAAAYAISALRIAWFKVYHPEAYYAAYFSVRADEFDYALMNQSLEKITATRTEMRKNFAALTDREVKVFYIIEIVEEMMLRGITFVDIDIEQAESRRFMALEKGKIMPALNSINSISTNMANGIVEARSDGEGEFKSHEDLRRRSGLGASAIETMVEVGILNHIPESAQISLFDMFA